jgi:hypothetical protein
MRRQLHFLFLLLAARDIFKTSSSVHLDSPIALVIPESTLALAHSGVKYFLIMEEEAIVAKVEPSERRKIDESLEMEFINVIFRVIRSDEDKGIVCKAVVTQPDWVVKLQPSAPLDGYLIERGEFTASLRKDDRIAPGLKIGIEVISP